MSVKVFQNILRVLNTLVCGFVLHGRVKLTQGCTSILHVASPPSVPWPCS